METPEVVFGCTPTDVLVTEKMTVQLPLAGIVMPPNARAVDPADNVFGVVPTQVPVTAPPAALILASVSLNAPPVSTLPLLLLNVSVTVEFVATWIVDGVKLFAIVGDARTVWETEGEELLL